MPGDTKNQLLRLYNPSRDHKFSIERKLGYLNFGSNQESYVLKYGLVSDDSDEKPIVIPALHFKDLGTGSVVGVSWKISDMVTNIDAAQSTASDAASAASDAASAANAAQSSADSAISDLVTANGLISALQADLSDRTSRLVYLEGVIADLLSA